MRSLPLLSAVLSAALLTACSAGAEPAPDPAELGIEGVQVTEGLGVDHVEGPVDYDQVPPVGGDHNAQWLRCEVYAEAVPPEFAVHSLEHGAVWLAHEPGVDTGPLTALKEIDATTEEYVLVSPEQGLPAPVVAVAWGLALPVQDPEDPRLEQFVRAYAGGAQGGEQGVPCTSSEAAVTPEQARELLAEQG